MTFPLDPINAMLDRVSRHPFHAGRLPARVASEDEFAASVPLMTRAEFVAEMGKPGYGGFGGAKPVRINLSPMGGGLVAAMQTAGDIANMIAACRTHLEACAITEDDVCAVTFGYHLFVAGLFYQTQMEAHGVACIPLGPGEAARAVEVCATHGVTVLAGNPSFSLKLIEAGLTPPRVFFAGGEAFTGNPTLYGAVRAAMPETVLVDSFSLSEFLPVARTFPGGTGVHVFDELVHAEVVDPATGEPVPDGERGELVLTHLKKEAQPLIRYRTGDLTLRQLTAPVCGRTVSLPRVVFGRTDDMVKVKGVKLYPSEVRAVLLGLDGLTGKYRITVAAKPGGGDRLALALEGTGGDDVLAEIARRFKSQTLISADDIEVVGALADGPLADDRRGRGMSDWRFIVDHDNYADFSVSVTPAVEKAVREGRAPSTVYLSHFDSDSITIGVNEDPEQVLDLDFCRANGIAFRRRLNGGGPIYAGKGSAIIVLFLKTDHDRVPETSAEAFPQILTAIAEVFERRYGFPARYRPLNDVQVEGRKLVPTSLKIEDGVMTFRIVVNLKPIDTELAGRAMPMPPEKVADKELKDLTSRFTWLEREAKREISEAELEAFTADCIAHAFGERDLAHADLSASERADAEGFRAEFQSERWLYGKSERNRFGATTRSGDTVGRGRVKAVGGMIRTTLLVRDGRVAHAIVNGDWHPRPLDSIAWLEAALEGAEATTQALAARVETFLARSDVEFAGVEPADLTAALDKAVADLTALD